MFIQHKMTVFLIFALVCVISAITETYCAKSVTFKYDGMDLQESLPNYFDISKAEIKLKEGSDRSDSILINGDIEQKVDLDDSSWTVEEKILRSDTADGEYINYLPAPKFVFGACSFMKSVFKYLFPIVKDCSNLPDPKTCPITKAKYHAENCELDAGFAQWFVKKGFYKIYADLYHEGQHKTGIVLRVSLHEK